MRVLLDENCDRRLKSRFAAGVEVMTVAERGWRGKENGDLLRAAHAEFDVLVTMDRGLEHQQNLRQIDLGIVILMAPSNRLADVEPLIPEVGKVLRRLRAGEVAKVGG